MEEALLQMAAQALPVLAGVFSLLGLILVVAVAVIRFTPSKKDDEFLEKLQAVPILGGLLAALMKRAPVKPADPAAK
jgi:hypothetical protein